MCSPICLEFDKKFESYSTYFSQKKMFRILISQIFFNNNLTLLPTEIASKIFSKFATTAAPNTAATVYNFLNYIPT